MRLIYRNSVVKTILWFISIFIGFIGVILWNKPIIIIGITLALFVPFVTTNPNKCNLVDRFISLLKLITPGYLWFKLKQEDTLSFSSLYPQKDGSIVTKTLILTINQKSNGYITVHYGGDDIRGEGKIDRIRTFDKDEFLSILVTLMQKPDNMYWNDESITKLK